MADWSVPARDKGRPAQDPARGGSVPRTVTNGRLPDPRKRYRSIAATLADSAAVGPENAGNRQAHFGKRARQG
eukprot:11929814-Heterocapsa_arctica.AAC.1